ncbi:MAG: YtxH domain-containing protein [Leptospiraceae bacterium]|nr:hypothetical protein [Leptospiraceae bacterium]MCP5499388.1 YtxH domain-containing protein [Leptospiraceae bacterium]
METAVLGRLAMGGILGMVGGYAYYRIIGCSSGACPLTSNPWTSSIYGAVLGLLISAQ